MVASRIALVSGIVFCIAAAFAAVLFSVSAASVRSADTHWTPSVIAVATSSPVTGTGPAPSDTHW